MKWVSLTALVVQTVSVVFATRISRTRVEEGPRYLNTTAVCCAEICKLILSFVWIWGENGSCARAAGLIRLQLRDVSDWLRMSVPSVLYAVQNNLLFVALSYLSGAEYQVTYQLKILSTALLSVLVLGKILRPLRWVALLLLTAGVALIQLREASSVAGSGPGGRALGLGAVVLASLTSGLAGVYMERLMKRTAVSMWVTNFQVALISVLVALAGALSRDGARIASGGFFQGYSCLVWVVISLQAGGGLVIGSVMKYADNILKCFGNALAVVISCLISSMWLREFSPDRHFVLGTALVLLAVIVYNLPDDALHALAGRAGGVAGAKPPDKLS